MFKSIIKFASSILLILTQVAFGMFLFAGTLSVVPVYAVEDPPSNENCVGSDEDLSLLQYCDLIDFLKRGVQPFLLSLAPVIGILAIIWGGYKYYFSSFTGKEDGLKAIQAGVIGLVITSGYSIVTSLLERTITGGGGGTPATLNSGPIYDFINDVIIGNFLLSMAGLAAVLGMIWGGYQYIASPLRKEDGLKTIKNSAIGLVVVLLAYPIQALITQTIVPNEDVTQVLQRDPVVNFLVSVVSKFLLPLSSVITVFFIIIAGYEWITAQGEERKVDAARSNVRNAVIGFVIVLLSFTITQIINYLIRNLNLGG